VLIEGALIMNLSVNALKEMGKVIVYDNLLERRAKKQISRKVAGMGTTRRALMVRELNVNATRTKLFEEIGMQTGEE
jgi:hypothetical protein